MTHPHPEHSDPKPALPPDAIKWSEASSESGRAGRSDCQLYTIAKIGTKPNAVYYEASYLTMLIHVGTKTECKDWCELHRANRLAKAHSLL